MDCYTIIANFDGGTYIAQVHARTPREALVSWANQLDVRAVAGMGPASRSRLIEDMIDENPVPIDGTSSVWCASSLVRGKLMLINLVRTVVEQG